MGLKLQPSTTNIKNETEKIGWKSKMDNIFNCSVQESHLRIRFRPGC